MNYNLPIGIKKYDIYDIFHNANNKLVIISPYILNPHIIHYIANDGKMQKFNLNKCPHKHTYIYSLIAEYQPTIKIMVGQDVLETCVNKHPSFAGEIIFSTIVKEEDAFIIPWITYHLRLGVSRFIIYDNSVNFTLSTVLDEYIRNKIVYLIKWDYPYIEKISGISGQTTQQNHSIYAFQDSQYIGLFDIDEYVNIQGKSNLPELFTYLIETETIDINKIGSFCILNKFFYNPNNLPVDNGQFLKIFNCDNITLRGREKNFVLPNNVTTFSVHKITSGKPMYKVDPKSVYFNHYIYLNKRTRGRCNTKYIDNTIISHLHP